MQDMAFQRVQFSKNFIYNFHIFSREIYGERQYQFLRRKTRNTFLVLQGPKALATWARLLKRKGFKVRKNTSEVCSNYFKYERPVDNHPHSTLFLKGYDREIVTRKRKAPMERLLVQPTTSNEKKSDTDSKQRVNIELILILWTFGRHVLVWSFTVYFSGKGDHYYSQTRHNDLFSHYNLILQNHYEKLPRKARILTERVFRIVLIVLTILLKSN